MKTILTLLSIALFCDMNAQTQGVKSYFKKSIVPIQDHQIKPDTVFILKGTYSNDLNSINGKVLGEMLRQTDTVYWACDSTKFTGVIRINEDKLADQCPNQMIFNFSNGLPIEMVEFQYSQTVFMIGNKLQVDTTCYLSKVNRNWYESVITFRASSDTIQSFHKTTINNQLYSETKLYEKNILRLKEVQKMSVNHEINEFYDYNDVGELMSCSVTMHFKTYTGLTFMNHSLETKIPESNLIPFDIDSTFEQCFSFNSFGDTILAVTRINNKYNGQIKQYYESEGETFIIESVWEDGLLADILNDDIIYISIDLQPISEASFIAIYNTESFNRMLWPIFIPTEMNTNNEAKMLLITNEVRQKLIATKKPKRKKELIRQIIKSLPKEFSVGNE